MGSRRTPFPLGVGIGVATAALIAMWFRRRDSVGSFSFAILAMLAATPVLWGFYFTAVLLPLALRRPRLSVAWVIPFLAAFVGGYTYTCIFLGLLVWCGIGAPSLRHVLSLRARQPRSLVVNSETPKA